MALDPEKQAPTAASSPSDAGRTASGPTADDASTALLQQIASQLSALTSQVTELQSEIEEVREENAAIREQTGAPKTKRLAYLGSKPLEQPETAVEPVAQGEEQKAEEPVPEKEDSPWKLYDKQGFADDFEAALENIEEVSWEDVPENEETDLLPDEEPFITKKMLSEMESDNPKMMAMISQFNEENPADFVQDDVTASAGQPRTAAPDPAPQKPAEADVTDDERQALQSAAHEQKSETPAEQEAASGTPMSDEDVQKLLSEAAEQAEELHPAAEPEQSAARAEEPQRDQGQEPKADAQEQPTAEQNEPAEPEQAADGGEDVTDAEVQQLLAGVAETAKAAEEELAERSPISQDELQELVSETEEAAADAPPIKPLPESSEESEDETVEVGFTAFQAGKDVGDETAEAQEEWPVKVVKQRREVVEPTFEVDPDAVAKVPAHLAIAALAVPVRIDETELVLRVAEPIDRIAFDIIGDATAMKVKPEPAPMEEVLAALRSAYGSDSCPQERQAVAGVAPRKLGKGVDKRFRRAIKKVKRR